MDSLTSTQPTTTTPPSTIPSETETTTLPATTYVPPPPPASLTTPRFPRHPCPSAHHTLSLLSSEHTAQRLFGPSFRLRSPTTGELQGPLSLLSYTDAWIPKYCAYIHAVACTPVFTARERGVIILAVVRETGAGWVGESLVEIERVHEGREEGLSERERNVFRLASEMAGNWGRVEEGTWKEVVMRDQPRKRGEEGWLEGEHEVRGDVEVDVTGKFEDVNTTAESGANAHQNWSAREKRDEEKPARLTREEVATLAQVVASTMFVSVLVNCADVEVPRNGADTLPQP